jgi:hypothetical protein
VWGWQVVLQPTKVVSRFNVRRTPCQKTQENSRSERRNFGLEKSDQKPLAEKGRTIGKKYPSERSLQCDFHGNSKDFLHAARLRHGADGFTSHPKEDMLTIIFARKGGPYCTELCELECCLEQ